VPDRLAGSSAALWMIQISYADAAALIRVLLVQQALIIGKSLFLGSD
jgi:hypothetical protein